MDIIIPFIYKDKNVIQICIRSCFKYVPNIRNIYIITNKFLQLNIPNVMIINEQTFPFTIKDVYGYLRNRQRCGWYLQQLLKLYSFKIIPDLTEKFLVVDADTIFVRNIDFFRDGKTLFDTSAEYHLPYFTHMKKFSPFIYKKYKQHSGICHHMIWNKRILTRLFSLVEKHHRTPLWKAFLRCIDPKEIAGSGASEYEIYFNFVFIYFPTFVAIRPLQHLNICLQRDNTHLLIGTVTQDRHIREMAPSFIEQLMSSNELISMPPHCNIDCISYHV